MRQYPLVALLATLVLIVLSGCGPDHQVSPAVAAVTPTVAPGTLDTLAIAAGCNPVPDFRLGATNPLAAHRQWATVCADSANAAFARAANGSAGILVEGWANPVEYRGLTPEASALRNAQLATERGYVLAELLHEAGVQAERFEGTVMGALGRPGLGGQVRLYGQPASRNMVRSEVAALNKRITDLNTLVTELDQALGDRNGFSGGDAETENDRQWGLIWPALLTGLLGLVLGGLAYRRVAALAEDVEANATAIGQNRSVIEAHHGFIYRPDPPPPLPWQDQEDPAPQPQGDGAQQPRPEPMLPRN